MLLLGAKIELSRVGELSLAKQGSQGHPSTRVTQILLLTYVLDGVKVILEKL